MHLQTEQLSIPPDHARLLDKVRCSVMNVSDNESLREESNSQKTWGKTNKRMKLPIQSDGTGKKKRCTQSSTSSSVKKALKPKAVYKCDRQFDDEDCRQPAFYLQTITFTRASPNKINRYHLHFLNLENGSLPTLHCWSASVFFTAHEWS